MRTRRQLEKYLKENKVIYESRNEESMDDYEHDWSFHVNGKKENLKAEWFGGKDYIAITGGIILNIGIRRAPYCCGVYEIGDFTNGDRYPHIWEAIIEYFLLVSRLPYLRTETITKSGTTQAVEIALKKLNFRLVTTIPSGHAKRNKEKLYKINVWEWIKPKKVRN